MHVIQIRLQHLSQLFDSLDPSPFWEKSLDRNAAAYLLECAGEHPLSESMEIAVHGPAELEDRLEAIVSAIHAHFLLLYEQAVRRHRHRARITRFAVLIGIAVLAAALLLRRLIFFWPGPAAEVIEEGLLILAWVALWRPAEVALFDHWESREERRQLKKLAQISVRFVGEPTVIEDRRAAKTCDQTSITLG